MNAPILLGSSVAYLLLDLTYHDTEIIRELLFVKKHLSNITDRAYSFEMKYRSSSDWEPVLPKISRKAMQKDYKFDLNHRYKAVPFLGSLISWMVEFTEY